MKTRIFGIIFVLVILGVLFVVSQDSGNQHPMPNGNSQSVDTDSNALRGLKIN